MLALDSTTLLPMTAQEIDIQYCKWSHRLHLWVTEHTGNALSVQYFPFWNQEQPKMRLFKGYPEYEVSGSGMPQLLPPSRVYVDFPLPRPEQNPTQEELDEAFRQLCVLAAQLLEIDLGKARLPGGNQPGESQGLESLDEPERPTRLRET